MATVRSESNVDSAAYSGQPAFQILEGDAVTVDDEVRTDLVQLPFQLSFQPPLLSLDDQTCRTL